MRSEAQADRRFRGLLLLSGVLAALLLVPPSWSAPIRGVFERDGRIEVTSEPVAGNTPLTGGPIDVNHADAASLQEIPGVGPTAAAAILGGRPYRDLADLDRRVPRLTPAALDAIAYRGTFEPPYPADAATPRSSGRRSAGTPRPRSSRKEGPRLIDPNTATVAELQRLPGIGPAIAARIVADRASHGPYASVEDLDRVAGIGPATVEKLRSKVSLP